MISWFAKNDVAANLLMLSIIGLGLLAIYFKVPLEVFPSFETDTIQVSTRLNGASPRDVEKGISILIEEALEELEGIKDISSRSSEGSSVVQIIADSSYSIDKLLREVKSEIDAINSFPQDADKPVITLIKTQREVINISIFGQYSESDLLQYAEIIKADLLQFNNISRVTIEGVREREISIEISQARLKQYNINIQEIANKINAESIDLSAGFLKTSGGDIALRTRSQNYLGEDFLTIPIKNTASGATVKLGDIATVQDGFGENQLISKFNNQPAVVLEVYRTGQQSAIDVAQTVKEYIEEKRNSLPNKLNIEFWNDRSRTVKARLNTLLKNAAQGSILILILLGLFLRPAIAFWICIGIPVSFLGAFLVMSIFGVTLNLISLFGFILVLGIVVDDAIVTGENIYTKLGQGYQGLDAAIRGTQEISVPVIFGILTTATAFMPLFFIEGARGAIFSQISAVVVPVLLFSLVESKLILPAHLKKLNYVDQSTSSWVNLQNKISSAFENFIQNRFIPALKFVMQFRFLFTMCFIGLFIITLAMVKGGVIRFSFFPKIPSERVSLNLTMFSGTPFEVTDTYISKIVSAAETLNNEYREQYNLDIIKNIYSVSGRGGSTNKGRVRLELLEAENRHINLNVKDLVARWRELIGEIPGAESFTINAQLGGGRGEPIDIELRGNNIENLSRVRYLIKKKLQDYQGIFDINDSLSDASQEYVLKLTPKALALGIEQSDIARQVRHAFYGLEVQRFQRGIDEVKVFIRTPQVERNTLNRLNQLPIFLPDGSHTPLQQLASLHAEYAANVIYRNNRLRTINVTADFNSEVLDLNLLIKDINQFLDQQLLLYPDISYQFRGTAEEQKESFSSLLIGLVIVLLVIYSLLAIPFKSYIQPLIVMSIIPFGLIGAIWGHVFMSSNLSVMSIMGMMALVGILVNDSLVLVDHTNKLSQENNDTLLSDIVIRAAGARFRPVILTSLTTFMGLLPLLFEQSLQAQFLIPMAISLAFGILFGTLIVLFLVPMNYLFINDIKRLWNKLFHKLQPGNNQISHSKSSL